MYIEGREEGDGGGRKREGGGASSLLSHLDFFYSQVVLISGAHVYQSMNLRRHTVSAQHSLLAYLLFMLTVIFA